MLTHSPTHRSSIGPSLYHATATVRESRAISGRESLAGHITNTATHLEHRAAFKKHRLHDVVTSAKHVCHDIIHRVTFLPDRNSGSWRRVCRIDRVSRSTHSTVSTTLTWFACLVDDGAHGIGERSTCVPQVVVWLCRTRCTARPRLLAS